MNNRGSILFISILVVAAISVIAATVVFTRSLGLVKVGRTYRMQVENSQLNHELAVIFANPKLCTSLLTISGNTFQAGEVFKAPAPGATPVPLKTNSSIAIKQMLVENIVSEPVDSVPWMSAEFSIVTQDLGDTKSPEVKNTLKGLYLAGSGGTVTDCRIKIDTATACVDLGFVWDAGASHCKMCEKMGGSWASDKCTLGATAGQ
jgi:hypothetical protein